MTRPSVLSAMRLAVRLRAYAFFQSWMFQVSLSNGRKAGPVKVFALPLENFRSTSGTDA